MSAAEKENSMASASPESVTSPEFVPASPEWSRDQGPWLLLACLPDVCPDEAYAPGTDLTLLAEHAPKASRLSVRRRIAPDPKDIYNHPYVAAVGDFGRFVLYATHGTRPEPQTVDDFDTGPDARLDYKDFPKALFLCDITTGTATRLPDREILIGKPGCVGLHTSAAESIVVELRPVTCSNQATLHCFSSSTGDWVVQDLFYPPMSPVQSWRGGDGVIKFMDCMIWVDLSIGMLSLPIPLLNMGRQQMQYIPFPEDCQCLGRTSGHAQQRCVGVSEGRLRFLENFMFKTFLLWTLYDLENAKWSLDGEISIEKLWEEEGFRSLNLPEEAPAVAFVHPEQSKVVYFLKESYLFSVDMTTGKLISSHFFNMNHPPADYHSSRFVRPWRLTPEIEGMFNWSNGPILTAKDKSPHGIYPLEGHTRLSGET